MIQFCCNRGNGDHGKLGHGSGRKVAVPHLVEKLKDYVSTIIVVPVRIISGASKKLSLWDKIPLS